MRRDRRALPAWTASLLGVSLALALFGELFGATTAHAGHTGRYAVEVLSDALTLDRKYASMEGPRSSHDVVLLDGKLPELLWLTGAQASVVGPDGLTPQSDEFLCHTTLRLNERKRHDPDRHNQLFGGTAHLNTSKLLTLVQGHTAIQFPDGFGIPIVSTEPLVSMAMGLNLNATAGDEPLQVRIKNIYQLARDRDLQEPLQPLFRRVIEGRVLVTGGSHHSHMAHGEETPEGSVSTVGVHAPYSRAKLRVDRQSGHTFSGQLDRAAGPTGDPHRRHGTAGPAV